MRRKKFNFLNEAKQIAKQLIIHRMWNGLSQESVANILGISFQQYQKVEKCENRCLAEQLLKICNELNWDAGTILHQDPLQTLDILQNNSKPKTRSNIVNSIEKIRSKLDKLDDTAYSNYFKERPLLLTTDMEVK